MTDAADGSALRSTEWWDLRLHQAFCLVALAYLAATWFAPQMVTLALGVLLFGVTIPLLVTFYALVFKSAPEPRISWVAVGAVLLAASLSWAVDEFGLVTTDWASVLPLAFLVIGSASIFANLLSKL